VTDAGGSAPRRAGLRTAALVLAVAGLVWWVVGVTALASGVAVALLVGAVVTAGFVLLGRRRLDGEGEAELFERNRRTWTTVNLLQGLGIAAVVVVCVQAGLQAWIPVGITFVFAVHFLPLGTAFGWRGWTVLAGVLALVAAGGAVLAADGAGPARVQTAVGVAVAVVLWAGVVGAVLSRGRPRRAPAPAPARRG
jgi:hypothetical protein